jgi:opacity protein-like surface antigen
MNRIVLIALIALAVPGGMASAGGVGLGGFAGTSVPILQDDAANGTLYGLRVPVTLMPLLTLEPYWARTRSGDVEETFADLPYTRDGGTVTAYGLNAMLAGGGTLRFYPYVGIASYRLEREASDDRTGTGYDAGLGLGLSPLPKLSLDLRGEFEMLSLGETSRKFVNVTLGVSYEFLSLR